MTLYDANIASECLGFNHMLNHFYSPRGISQILWVQVQLMREGNVLQPTGIVVGYYRLLLGFDLP